MFLVLKIIVIIMYILLVWINKSIYYQYPFLLAYTEKTPFDFGQSNYLKGMLSQLSITDICSTNAHRGHAA